MTSFGKVTPLILPGLGNLRAQLPLLNVLLRVCRNLIHRIHLFVVLLSPKSGEYFHASKGVSISTLRDEFKKYIQPFFDGV